MDICSNNRPAEDALSMEEVDKLVLSSLTQELTTAETTAGEAEEAS